MNISVTLAGRSLALALTSLLLTQAQLQAQALKQTARHIPRQPANPVARGANTLPIEAGRAAWKPEHVTLATTGAESTAPKTHLQFASANSTPVAKHPLPAAGAAPSLPDGPPTRVSVLSIQATGLAPAPTAKQGSLPASASEARSTHSTLERRYPDLIKLEPRFRFAPGEISVDPLTHKPQGVNLFSFRF